jgi:hypothetical protein
MAERERLLQAAVLVLPGGLDQVGAVAEGLSWWHLRCRQVQSGEACDHIVQQQPIDPTGQRVRSGDVGHVSIGGPDGGCAAEDSRPDRSPANAAHGQDVMRPASPAGDGGQGVLRPPGSADPAAGGRYQDEGLHPDRPPGARRAAAGGGDGTYSGTR